MSTNIVSLALVLSVVAVGVAGYAVLQERPASTGLEVRLHTLEEQFARLEAAEAQRDYERRTLDGPALATRAPQVAESVPAGLETPLVADAGERGGADTAAGTASGTPTDLARPSDEIQELVDAAVAKKAAEIQVMRDKKPHIDVFAKTLELTELQRAAAEQDIVRSQQEIKAILETPAEDGTNFMDELVEIMARGIAEPGQNPGRGMKLFGRLMAEKVPGTDETYAMRAESVKASLRETFKRNWNEKQYATFHAWQMDPTEVKDIPGSPWKEVEGRVIERAKELGAEIPGDDDLGPR